MDKRSMPHYFGLFWNSLASHLSLSFPFSRVIQNGILHILQCLLLASLSACLKLIFKFRLLQITPYASVQTLVLPYIWGTAGLSTLQKCWFHNTNIPFVCFITWYLPPHFLLLFIGFVNGTDIIFASTRKHIPKNLCQ